AGVPVAAVRCPGGWPPGGCRRGCRPSRFVPGGRARVGEPRRHLLAGTEFVDELGVQPRLVDTQAGVGEQTVPVEPLDVVTLEGGTVAPDLYVVLEHGAHQQGAGDGPSERGGVEVGPTTGAD